VAAGKKKLISRPAEGKIHGVIPREMVLSLKYGGIPNIKPSLN